MAKRHAGIFVLIAGLAAALAGGVVYFGVAVPTPWALPLFGLGLLGAYLWSVHIPGFGRMDVDHLVVFPAVLVLKNPAVVALLAAACILFGAVVKKGERKRIGVPGIVFNSVQVGLTVLTATAVLLASGAFEPGRGVLSKLLWTILSLGILFFQSLVTVSLYNWIEGKAIWTAAIRRFMTKALSWFVGSLPFLVLAMHFLVLAVGGGGEENWGWFFLSLSPLVAIGWVLRLIGKVESQNEGFAAASRRQEFLLQTLLSEIGSLENEAFLKNLLAGLAEFIASDRDLIFLVETPFQRDPVFYSRTGLPPDPHLAKAHLEQQIEQGQLQVAHASGPGHFTPLLSPGSRQQLLVPLATREVAFGALVMEREGDKPFEEEEVQFANLAMAQVGQHIQDGILKRQLLNTNRRLIHQTHYLSEILEVSNLLKIHMDPAAILEKVAEGVRSGMSFGSVLISLYREEDHCFERVAQAGDDEHWEAIRSAKPPAGEILSLLEDRFRFGNCYYARHTEKPPSPYDVPSVNPVKPKAPDDWDPEDILLVPLLSKENRLIGVISVDEPVDGKIPSMETFNALEIIANQAVQALESSQVHASVRHQASVDGLTNLYNHRHFQESLVRMGRECGSTGRPFSVLMIDLDDFKGINDRYGHLTGDAVLRSVGEVILSTTRREDVAARYGGEEFAMILPGLDALRAKAIAERVRKLVEETPFTAEGLDGPLHVTLSVGVATFTGQEGMGRQQEVLESADAALYRAKRGGKNRVCGADGD